MENPLQEIDGVIKTLCKGSPAAQRRALETYFLPNASFVHPFCAVHSYRSVTLPPLLPGFLGGSSRPTVLCTRDAIAAIYRWYRFLSPDIELHIDSKAYDEHNQVLYVTIRQRFAIWFVPFYAANVRLVCELHLSQQRAPPPRRLQTTTAAAIANADPAAPATNARQSSPRYYIAKQEDHYQVNEFLRFVLPVFAPLAWLVWQQISTLICVFLALPILILDRTFGVSKEDSLAGGR